MLEAAPARCAMLPGTERQCEQFRAVVAQKSFVALDADPQGSGKRTQFSGCLRKSTRGLHRSEA